MLPPHNYHPSIICFHCFIVIILLTSFASLSSFFASISSPHHPLHHYHHSSSSLPLQPLSFSYYYLFCFFYTYSLHLSSPPCFFNLLIFLSLSVLALPFLLSPPLFFSLFIPFQPLHFPILVCFVSSILFFPTSPPLPVYSPSPLSLSYPCLSRLFHYLHLSSSPCLLPSNLFIFLSLSVLSLPFLFSPPLLFFLLISFLSYLLLIIIFFPYNTFPSFLFIFLFCILLSILFSSLPTISIFHFFMISVFLHFHSSLSSYTSSSPYTHLSQPFPPPYSFFLHLIHHLHLPLYI